MFPPKERQSVSKKQAQTYNQKHMRREKGIESWNTKIQEWSKENLVYEGKNRMKKDIGINVYDKTKLENKDPLKAQSSSSQ